MFRLETACHLRSPEGSKTGNCPYGSNVNLGIATYMTFPVEVCTEKPDQEKTLISVHTSTSSIIFLFMPISVLVLR